MYRVTFYYVDSSGRQKNQSLFESKDLALSFCIQISMGKNIEDVSCDLVRVETISVIDLCESLHGNNGSYKTVCNNQEYKWSI